MCQLRVYLSNLQHRRLFYHAMFLLAEFVAVMSRKVNASYTADQVKSAFKVGVTYCELRGEAREILPGALVHFFTTLIQQAAGRRKCLAPRPLLGVKLL